MNTEIKYNEQNLPYEVFTPDRKLVIKILNWEDPNNGRMLWRVNVFYEGENIDNLIFKNEWNCINQNLSQLNLVDEKNQYYYIPAESEAVLFNSIDRSLKRLEFNGASTIRFTQNFFYKDWLFEIYTDKIQAYNMQEGRNITIENGLEGYFVKLLSLTDNKINVLCYRFENNQRVEFEMEFAY